MSIDIYTGQGVFENDSRSVTINDTPMPIGNATLLYVQGDDLPIQAVEWQGSTLTLLDPYAGTSGTKNIVLGNTLEGLSNAIRRLKDGINDVLALENAIDSVLTSTDPTVDIELSDGSTVEIVPWGFVKAEIESEWDALQLEIDAKQARLDVQEKLKRDAVLYLPFCSNEMGKEVSDLSVTRDDATSLITYTAPDGQTGITADGRVATAGVNTPAIVYNEGECQGLQVVPESTNLLLWSEDFSQSAWVKDGCSISIESGISSPVEGGSVYKLAEGTNSGEHNLQQEISAGYFAGKSSGLFIAKAAERTKVQILVGGTDMIDTGAVDIDLTLTESTNNSIYLGDGWHLLYTVGEIGSTDGFIRSRIRPFNADGSTVNYAGDGVSGIYLAAAQLEQGYPTPYIKTEGSQVTRGAVAAQKTSFPVNFNVMNFYWEGRPYFASGTNEFFTPLMSASNGTNTGSFNINYQRVNQRFDVRVYTDSETITIQPPNLGINQGDFARVLGVIDLEEGLLKLYINGVKYTSASINPDDLTAYKTNNQLLLGSGLRNLGDQGYSKVECRKAAIFTVRLSDAEATALTTLEDE